MPHKSWKHHCQQRQREVTTHQEICEHCGQPGQFIGWTYNRIEALNAYTTFTGLKAVGPHRPLADAIFSDLIIPCEICSGRGLLDVDQGAGCRPCPMCNGTGRTLGVAPHIFSAARLRVLLIYPDAAVGVPPAEEESKYDRYLQ